MLGCEPGSQGDINSLLLDRLHPSDSLDDLTRLAREGRHGSQPRVDRPQTLGERAVLAREQKDRGLAHHRRPVQWVARCPVLRHVVEAFALGLTQHQGEIQAIVGRWLGGEGPPGPRRDVGVVAHPRGATFLCGHPE